MDSLPSTLETYFRETLGRLDPIHRHESSQILLAMKAARRPIDIVGAQLLDDPLQGLSDYLEERASGKLFQQTVSEQLISQITA